MVVVEVVEVVVGLAAVVVVVEVEVVVVDGLESVSQPELPSNPPFMYLLVSLFRPPPQ